MASYNINVSVGRDCGCEISDEEFAHYLAACKSAIASAYPDASVSVDEHEGSGTRVGNSRPWADDDHDLNDTCNGICQDVWEACCADSFGAGARASAAAIAHKLYLCAIQTPRNDGGVRTDADLEQDGCRSYDQWTEEAANAGDHATLSALQAVEREDFAAEWEALLTPESV